MHTYVVTREARRITREREAHMAGIISEFEQKAKDLGITVEFNNRRNRLRASRQSGQGCI